MSEGLKVITVTDQRWDRCDIKSVSLLPNILGKQAAVEAGAYDAWQVDGDGRVTEGTSTNAWLVTPDNTVVTRDATHSILTGITRLALIELIRKAGYRPADPAFSVERAGTARRALLASSTPSVLPLPRPAAATHR